MDPHWSDSRRPQLAELFHRLVVDLQRYLQGHDGSIDDEFRRLCVRNMIQAFDMAGYDVDVEKARAILGDNTHELAPEAAPAKKELAVTGKAEQDT